MNVCRGPIALRILREAVQSQACEKYTCQDPSTCNVCTACCHEKIKDGAECDVCVQERCKRLRPTPPPPTRKWEPCKEMDQQCGGAKNSCCPGLICSPVGGGVFVCE